MTQTEARHIAPQYLGDPEPVGLASSWNDGPPARRALAVEQGPHFQATPVRVDEAFPEYEAYHSVIEPSPMDAVDEVPTAQPSEGWDAGPIVGVPVDLRTEDYGWVPGSLHPQPQPPVAPGLAPYPTTGPAPAPVGPHTPAAPMPTGYGFAPEPYPYQGTPPQPVPGAFPAGGMPDPYLAETSTSDGVATALVAAGGAFLILRKVAAIVPLAVVSIALTIVAVMIGDGAWFMAGFMWLLTLVAVFARPGASRSGGRFRF